MKQYLPKGGFEKSPLRGLGVLRLGMCLFIYALEFFQRVVRVNLGRGKAAVAQQVFDGIQIGSLVEQMRGKRVAQHVRAAFAGLRLGQVFAHNPLDQHGVGGLARVGHDEPRIGCALERAFLFGLVRFQQRKQARMERNDALFVALAGDFDGFVEPGDAVLIHAQQLGQPDARAVEQFQHQLVAHAFETGGKPGAVQHLVELPLVHEMRQLLAFPERTDFEHRVAVYRALLHQEPVKSAQGGNFPVYRGGIQFCLHQTHNPRPDSRETGHFGLRIFVTGLQVGGKLRQIGLVRSERVGAAPLFVLEIFEEFLDHGNARAVLGWTNLRKKCK